jgi:hypothetical protein
MKREPIICFMNSIIRHSKRILVFATALSILPALRTSAANIGETFRTPDDAVKALTRAVNSKDTNALANIFGPDFKEIESTDPVQAQNELTTVAQRLNESTQIERVDNNRCILDMGRDQFPFAVPIVQKDGKWYFDTDAGKDELINRRIGRNELDVLKSVRAYVDAQRDYASKDRNGDEVLEYAQKFVSSPGKQDGLYWSKDVSGEESPLGPLFVEGQGEGYFQNASQISTTGQTRKPFHGYYFKILTKQGKNAPGGAFDYIINGHMIAGFGLVAWPADYGESGVMTFIINQQGKVYQKDLGKNTESIVENMQAYDPDSTWKLSRD